jgi:flagellar motor switch protein FliN/FliY
MPSGALVELDREADEAIDLYADGMRVATGRLLVTSDGGLAVRIEAIAGTAGWDADPSDPSDSKTLNQTVEV